MSRRRPPPSQRKGEPLSGPVQSIHDGATRLLSVAMIVLGVLLVFRSAVLGIIIGVAMIGAGAGRLWVVAQHRRAR
jgi:hypothetical protein